VFEAARVDNIAPGALLGHHLPDAAALLGRGGVHPAGGRVQGIDTVFVMTGGGPGTSTETLTLYAYNEGFKKFNIGMTSALSFTFSWS
jgi:multiple sugar transport system permease protein